MKTYKSVVQISKDDVTKGTAVAVRPDTPPPPPAEFSKPEQKPASTPVPQQDKSSKE